MIPGYPNPKQVSQEMDIFNVDRFGDASQDPISVLIATGDIEYGKDIKVTYDDATDPPILTNFSNETTLSDRCAYHLTYWVTSKFPPGPNQGGDIFIEKGLDLSHDIAPELDDDEIQNICVITVADESIVANVMQDPVRIYHNTPMLPLSSSMELARWVVKSLTDDWATFKFQARRGYGERPLQWMTIRVDYQQQ